MTHINLVSIFKMISLVKRPILFQVRDDLDEDVAVSDDDILSLHDNSSNDDLSIDDDIKVRSWIVFDSNYFMSCFILSLEDNSSNDIESIDDDIKVKSYNFFV
jgi:hypothetical protein